ncbi:MAG: substrate-binding domain-containing protein, partial [Spirochaetes bacterium]|nr:substrate-binding domain-containing protein [Spirochaetota bacterium]
MKMLIVIVLALCAALAPLSADPGRLRLATTTSTEDSGLLSVLNPPFEKLTGVKIDVIAVGSGKAIKLGENGDVDVVLVHDRA